MNQQKLAKAVGISQSVISDIERGVIAESVHVVQLSRVLGVNPLWLEASRGPRSATESQATQAPVPFDPETIEALLQLPERWLGRAEQAVREILKEYRQSTVPPDGRTPPAYAVTGNRHSLTGKRKLK